MQKYILIEADTNDADYISTFNPITDEEIELIKPIINAIKGFMPYVGISIRGSEWTHSNNFPTGECYRQDLGEKSAEELYGHLDNFDLFDNFVPYCEYGIHTIESIKIVTILEELLWAIKY